MVIFTCEACTTTGITIIIIVITLSLYYFLRSLHFLEGGWARGIPMSMNVKSPGPPFIFVVKKCDPPQEAVKFIVTHLFVVSNFC